MKPFAFICSPYRNVPDAEERSIRLARRAYNDGYMPLVPHLHFTRFLDDNVLSERTEGIEAGEIWLSQCAIIYVDDTTGISEGMAAEIAEAKRLGMPVHLESEVKP